MLLRRVGNEAVAGAAGEVNDFRVGTGLVRLAGVAGHDVRIDIDRIDRVGDGDFVFVAEHVEDVPAIALRAVADEHLVVGHVEALVAEIILRNRGAEKIIALLRPIAFEGGAAGHFIDGPVQRGDNGGRERLGHIADAATDQARGGGRVRIAKHFHAPADFGEEVAGLEFEIIVVEISHVSDRCLVFSHPWACR